jgi:hypothetical protein
MDVKVGRHYMYYGRDCKIIRGDFFRRLEAQCIITKNSNSAKQPLNNTMQVPILALDAIEIIGDLNYGIKQCQQCKEYFFNPRKNVFYCNEYCRYRHHYLKQKEK